MENPRFAWNADKTINTSLYKLVVMAGLVEDIIKKSLLC